MEIPFFEIHISSTPQLPTLYPEFQVGTVDDVWIHEHQLQGHHRLFVHIVGDQWFQTNQDLWSLWWTMMPVQILMLMQVSLQPWPLAEHHSLDPMKLTGSQMSIHSYSRSGLVSCSWAYYKCSLQINCSCCSSIQEYMSQRYSEVSRPNKRNWSPVNSWFLYHWHWVTGNVLCRCPFLSEDRPHPRVPWEKSKGYCRGL